MKLSREFSEELAGKIKRIESKIGGPVFPEPIDKNNLDKIDLKYPARYRGLIDILESAVPPTQCKKAKIATQRIRLLNNLGNYLLAVERGEEKILLSRQVETLRKLHDFLEKGNTSGHVTLPTGVGKTVIYSQFLEAASYKNPIKSLIVGPTKIILHQNRWKLDEFGDINAGVYFGAEKDLSKDVTVITYASLRNGLKIGRIDPSQIELLVLDEAHHALGEQTISSIEKFPEDIIKIGFTATPGYHETKTVAEILPITIDELSLREAIKSNLLAGLKVYLVSTKKDISGIGRKGREYEGQELERFVNTKERNGLIVDIYLKNILFNGKRAVVYCAGRQHEKDMAAHFQEKGVKALYIDGTTNQSKREQIFNDFKNGNAAVLCNAEVLIEGFDEPEAEVCINAAPTLSRVVAEQRGGRVLRRSKLYDDKIGHIIDVIDDVKDSENTPVLFSEIAGAAEIMPDDGKKTKHRGNHLRNIRGGKEVTVTNFITDPDEIMVLTNKNKRQRYTKDFKYAPKGWVHPIQLAHECMVKESEIRGIFEQTRAEHPEWFKRYLTSTEILVTHYHPNLVDRIRRHYITGLEGTVTPMEHAEKNEISLKDAEIALAAAEEATTTKPIKFSDKTYYPEREYRELILMGERFQRDFEENEISEAEEEFWSDDELSDEERERRYWDRFEDAVLAEEKDQWPFWQPFRAPFDDDKHQISSEFFSDLDFGSERRRESILKILGTLDSKRRDALIEYFFEGKTYEQIGREKNVSRALIGFRMKEGLRQLRHPMRLNLLEIARINNEPVDDSLIDRMKSDMLAADLRNMNMVQLSEAFLRLEKKAAESRSNNYNVLLYSIIPRDLENLRKFILLPNREKEHVYQAFASNEVRAFIFGCETKYMGSRALSSDKKMIDAYGLSNLDSHIKFLRSRRIRTEKQEIRLREFKEIRERYHSHFGK